MFCSNPLAGEEHVLTALGLRYKPSPEQSPLLGKWTILISISHQNLQLVWSGINLMQKHTSEKLEVGFKKERGSTARWSREYLLVLLTIIVVMD